MDFSFDIEFVKNPCFILSSKINVDNFPDVNNSFMRVLEIIFQSTVLDFLFLMGMVGRPKQVR